MGEGPGELQSRICKLRCSQTTGHWLSATWAGGLRLGYDAVARAVTEASVPLAIDKAWKHL